MVTDEDSLGFISVNHLAYQVRTGMMNAAIFFFEKKLKWIELPHRKVTDDWGQARFFTQQSDYGVVIQLTELSDDDPKLEMSENHIAIHSELLNPKEAAEYILEWANYACAGEGASIEAANSTGSKWFVYLPALFKFGLEIV